MIEFGVKAPMLERWCAAHEAPLLELRCAYQHGLIWDNATRTRVPSYECDAWYLVRDGIVVAECSEEGTRWLRGRLDGTLTPKLAGRKDDGTGGRPYHVDKRSFVKRDSESRRECKRRAHERAKAAREGREPAEWARLQAPSRRKVA